MKKIVTILVAIALIAMIGTASAGYGINSDVLGTTTLDIGESQTFNVTVTDSTGASTFNVMGADLFTVTIDDKTVSSMNWDGGTQTFVVMVTNVDASNGMYKLKFINVDSLDTIGMETTVEVLINAIPEFPTIALPIAAILGLAFIFQRRREEE